jgi:hypothetical protein
VREKVKLSHALARRRNLFLYTDMLRIRAASLATVKWILWKLLCFSRSAKSLSSITLSSFDKSEDGKTNSSMSLWGKARNIVRCTVVPHRDLRRCNGLYECQPRRQVSLALQSPHKKHTETTSIDPKFRSGTGVWYTYVLYLRHDQQWSRNLYKFRLHLVRKNWNPWEGPVRIIPRKESRGSIDIVNAEGFEQPLDKVGTDPKSQALTKFWLT